MSSADQEPSEPVIPGDRLSGTVYALGVVSFLTDVASEMVYTQVPLFITKTLGAPAAVVGIIEGVAESSASLLKIVSGRLSDKSGRRKPLAVAGYALGAIYKPLLALAVSWPAILLLRFIDRLGKGLRSSPRDALIADTTPQHLRGRAFGLHRTMDTTGAVVGPLLGLWFLTHVSPDLRKLFLFAGIPGALAVLSLLLFVREPKHSRTLGPQVVGPIRWGNLDPAYRRFIWAAFLFNLGNSSDAFLILRAGSLGFTSTQLLVLYAAFNVTEMCLGYSAGILSDKIGRRPLIISGYIVFALVYLGFALVHTKVGIWVLFLLYGGYYTLTQGTQRAFAADMADPKHRAAQIGVFQTAVGIALLPASIIAGKLFDWNPAAPFYYGALMALMSIIVFMGVKKPTIESI